MADGGHGRGRSGSAEAPVLGRGKRRTAPERRAVRSAQPAGFIGAYLIQAAAPCGGLSARSVYAAMSDTPENAVELVRALVAVGTVLTATGDTLAPAVATALGLQPGRARLV